MSVFCSHRGSEGKLRTWRLALLALAATTWPNAGQAAGAAPAAWRNADHTRLLVLRASSPARPLAYRAVARSESARQLSYRGQTRARARAAARHLRADLHHLATDLEAALVTQGTLELLHRAAHTNAVPGSTIRLSPVAALALIHLSRATEVSPGRALATVVQLAAICQLNPMMTAPMAALLAMTALAGPTAHPRTAPAAEARSAAGAEPAANLRQAAREAWTTGSGAAAGGGAESPRAGARPKGPFATGPGPGGARRTQHRPFGHSAFSGGSYGFERASGRRGNSGTGPSGHASGSRETHRSENNASGGRESRASSRAQASSSEHPLAWAYGRLGLKPGASYAEALKAYRRQAMALHPDRPNGSAEKFKAMKAGFDALRAAHNAAGTKTRAPSTEARANAAAQRRNPARAEPTSSASAASTPAGPVLALPAPGATAN